MAAAQLTPSCAFGSPACRLGALCSSCADALRPYLEQAADAALLEAEREHVATWTTGQLWHAAVSDAGQRHLYGYDLTFYQRAVIDELRERGEAIDAAVAEWAEKRAAYLARRAS